MTPRTGDDAGLREVAAKVFADAFGRGREKPYPFDYEWAERVISTMRSWDEANAGSVPVAVLMPTSVRDVIRRALDHYAEEAQDQLEHAENSDEDQTDGPEAERQEVDDITEARAFLDALPPAPGEAAAPVRDSGTV